MKIFNKYKIIIVSLMCISINGVSQDKIHVIKKIVTKEYSVSEIPDLQIKGEKSDIFVTGWKNKTIKVEIQLISKNPVKEKAEKELKYISYSCSKQDNKIILSNTFISSRNTKISSNLSTKFIIYLPELSNVHIENLYGNINLNDLSLENQIQNSFGEVKINNVKGLLHLDLHYADIHIADCNANIICTADNSDLYFNNVSKSAEITSNYGKIIFNPGNSLKNLSIKSSRTEITVNVDQFTRYSYSLLTQNSVLKIHENFTDKIITDNKITRFDLEVFASNPKINVETSYCPIIINSIKQ